MSAPIALFTYNRPNHTIRTLESLSKNRYAKTSHLHIYSDGPKSEKDEPNILKVREMLNNSELLNRFLSVKIINRTYNLGLAGSIIDGVTNLTNDYGNVIVLEDDLLTSDSFLEYMNYSLDKFKNSKEVSSVNAYFTPLRKKTPAYFMLYGNDSWGWATWKNSWDELILDSDEIFNRLRTKEQQKKFNFDGAFPFYEMLKSDPNDWHAKWYATSYFKRRLGLYTSLRLITNIGMDGSGTHGGLNHDVMNLPLDNGININFELAIEENKTIRSEIIRDRKNKKLRSHIMNKFNPFHLLRVAKGKIKKHLVKLQFKYFLRVNGLTKINDIPTHLTNEEKLLLHFQSKKAKVGIIEIGSYLGASSCFLASGMKGHLKLTCVDTWNNEGMAEGIRDTYKEFTENTRSYGTKITTIRGLSHQTADEVSDSFDLIFFDGDHSYTGIKNDWEAWKGKLSDQATVVFHDYGWAEGVKRVVDELVKPHAVYEEILPNTYWAVIQRPKA